MKKFTKNFASLSEITKLAVANVGRWAVYIANGLDSDKGSDRNVWRFVNGEIEKMYPDADVRREVMGVLMNGGLFFFDTSEQMNAFYRVFDAQVTDSSAMYACTYSPDGECQTENT